MGIVWVSNASAIKSCMYLRQPFSVSQAIVTLVTKIRILRAAVSTSENWGHNGDGSQPSDGCQWAYLNFSRWMRSWELISAFIRSRHVCWGYWSGVFIPRTFLCRFLLTQPFLALLVISVSPFWQKPIPHFYKKEQNLFLVICHSTFFSVKASFLTFWVEFFSCKSFARDDK